MLSNISPSCFSLFLSVHVAFAALPLIDFDRMGSVGLAGAFAGLDLFNNASSGTFNPSVSTLLSRDQQGSLTSLASTNDGGVIFAACFLEDTYYVAGSFSSLGGVTANNIASYTVSSGVVNAVGSDGPNGQIGTVFCDQKGGQVWVGGTFSSPGLNVAVWDPKSRTWSKPPFVGLSGAQSKVLSITTNESDTSIFFSGSFITTFPGDGSTILNGTNNPNVPFSAGATPFSSSLVPIPLQGAQIDGSPSTSDPQFNDINNILCPLGGDGPGNSWFAADSSTPLITVRTFTSIFSDGLRLGNTFQSNHGATAFSVTTIPDNSIQTLHYRDPATGETQTCSDTCPLSTDSSLLYQDFLFDNTLAITGVQIKLSGFVGVGPGLHILQLLSSGAFVSAVDSENALSCFASTPSNTTRTGDWAAKLANTDIAGTTQTVLVSDVAVGTRPSDGPTFTWIPYVSAPGNYDINLLVPGCGNFLDCPSRTSVNVTVFPGDGLAPRVAAISQQNQEDTTVLLYSGPIVPSSTSSVTTIEMMLADNPTGSGQNGKYELVADRVQLVLKSVNGSTSDSTDGSGGAQGTTSAFGFFEWPRALDSSSPLDATKTLPNSTLTPLDTIGFSIFNGAGGINGLSFANPSAITTVVHHPSGIMYLGGNFTLSSGTASGAANLVAFKDGALVTLAQNGLNGPVAALAYLDNELFVGGAFTDTLSGSTRGTLKGIARYDIQADEWSPLGAGVDGSVMKIDTANGQLLIAGNFNQVLSSVVGDAGAICSGFATWDLKSSSWINSGGFVVGNMTFVGNYTTTTQIIAGNVATSRKFGANGLVMLKNGKTEPVITPLGVQLDVPTNISSLNTSHRRSLIRTSTWVSHISRLKLSKYFTRQTQSQLAPLPASIPAPAPAVLAGAFWTNATSTIELAILGGNFSFVVPGSSTSAQGIAIYDNSSATVSSLRGSQINGIVRSLLVDGNLLYIGGEFVIEGVNVNGLAVYDLSAQTWDMDAIPALQGASGSTVVVRSITTSSSKANTIIVAGRFSQAGSLNCQSICAYDTSSRQWNTLGNGIQGEVASVVYAGDNQELLLASGSIALSDNSISNVVQYSFSNATWVGLDMTGDLLGPVSAIEVNDGNASSIFAAGRSEDGATFLSFWNGIAWSTLSSTLQAGTTISQLIMVPLQDSHSANNIIESDRMLMVSGSLHDATFGNASSALFDGQTLIPYIVSSLATSSPGAVASLFHSYTTFSFSHRRLLATGIIILISIAIAAGVVFLLALTGILWTLLSRRDDRLNKHDAVEDDDDDSTHHRPSSLLEHINAATRTTILGVVPSNGTSADKEEEKIALAGHDPFGPDASNYIRAETPSDAVGGILAEETSRPARARYSFDGTGEGELPISAGAEVEVLDDRDLAWWYARDTRTGREGVVPAAYLY